MFVVLRLTASRPMAGHDKSIFANFSKIPVKLPMVHLEFEWDDEKAASNYHKSGITFEEAILFFCPNPIEEENRTAAKEERWQTLGVSKAFVLLLVVHTVRENGSEIIRIISARRTAPHERRKCYGNRQIYNGRHPTNDRGSTGVHAAGKTESGSTLRAPRV